MPCIVIESVLALVIAIQSVAYISLQYRRHYLRAKLMFRLNEEEKRRVDKTDLDFWAFLK